MFDYWNECRNVLAIECKYSCAYLESHEELLCVQYLSHTKNDTRGV